MYAGDKKVEGVVPGVEAAPVLQLPEGGPIATGEEDENTVFFSESVLFNFDAGWKERGRGELRVLVAPSGQCWSLAQSHQKRLMTYALNMNLWDTFDLTPSCDIAQTDTLNITQCRKRTL